MRGDRPILVVLIAAGALAAAAQASTAQDVPRMKALVNETRTQHDLPPVRFSAVLARSALLKARAIRRCGSFSHTPCGASFTRTFTQVGYRFGAVGENLAWGTGSLAAAQAILKAWLRSPPHRAILLDRRWRAAGLATIDAALAGYSHVRLWVLQFGDR